MVFPFYYYLNTRIKLYQTIGNFVKFKAKGWAPKFLTSGGYKEVDQ